jgi:hypothetical protein
MTAEVSAYIRHHESVIAPLHKDYSLKFWNLSLDGTNEALEKDLVAAKEPRAAHVDQGSAAGR